MADRYARIAEYVRGLSDHDLNDLLLDLQPERYGVILDAVPMDVPAVA